MLKIIFFITILGFVNCGPAKYRTRRVPRDIRLLLTFPGTKWCGAGNTADDYDELGSAWEEDKCCREHDYCSDIIPPHGTKHDLLNDSSYTRTSCDCDMKFYRCLKKLDSYTADFVGKIYFNIYNAKCFQKDYKSDCLRRRDFSAKCEFEWVYPSPKVYQWFKTPYY